MYDASIISQGGKGGEIGGVLLLIENLLSDNNHNVSNQTQNLTVPLHEAGPVNGPNPGIKPGG